MPGCRMKIKKNQNKTVPQRMLCKGEPLGLLLRNMNCSRLTIRAFKKKKKKKTSMTCQEMMDTIDKALFLSKLNEIFYSLVLVGGPGFQLAPITTVLQNTGSVLLDKVSQ